MSKAKDLRNLPENNINMYELLSLFSPNGKSKYTETLIRIMKNTDNLSEHAIEVKNYYKSEFGLTDESLNRFTNLQISFFYRFIESMFESDDIKTFQRFCEYNERGLIAVNDLSTYSTWDQVVSSVSLADIIVDSKELSKQTKMVYEDTEWLVIRPLTFEASKKYGSSTKWCTTQDNNPEYFNKYAKGVLIYTINKKTGYKVASYYSLDSYETEYSFWNQVDSRIDSSQTELSRELIDIIFKESKYSNVSNKDLLPDELRKKSEDKSIKRDSEPVANQPLGEVRGGVVTLGDDNPQVVGRISAHTGERMENGVEDNNEIQRSVLVAADNVARQIDEEVARQARELTWVVAHENNTRDMGSLLMDNEWGEKVMVDSESDSESDDVDGESDSEEELNSIREHRLIGQTGEQGNPAPDGHQVRDGVPRGVWRGVFGRSNP